MELRPGQSLGDFILGSTLSNTIDLVRSRYPEVKSSFAWDDSSPSSIYLTLSRPPVQLLFSPDQRLIRIQLVYPRQLRNGIEVGEHVVYRGKKLKKSEGESTLTMLRRTIGPTAAATHKPSTPKPIRGKEGSTGTNEGEREEEGEETLTYPGVTFSLADDANSALIQIIITPLRPSKSPEEAWQYPEIVEPLSSSLERVYEGDVRQVSIQLDAAKRPTSATLTFYLVVEDSELSLVIGQTTTEDVTAVLGAPTRSFWKEDDRMSIHSSLTDQENEHDPNPYFIFYPHLALTLLIHPTNHTVLKIILHSNLPGEVNFGRTGKSPWLINTFEGESRSSSDNFTRIKDVWSSTGEGDEAAMILDRAVEGGEGLKGDRSLTEIHGFPGIAFEVTKSNYIETLWLF